MPRLLKLQAWPKTKCVCVCAWGVGGLNLIFHLRESYVPNWNARSSTFSGVEHFSWIRIRNWAIENFSLRGTFFYITWRSRTKRFPHGSLPISVPFLRGRSRRHPPDLPRSPRARHVEGLRRHPRKRKSPARAKKKEEKAQPKYIIRIC